jgi:hypothetical protein
MRRPFPIWKVPVQAGGSRGPSTPQTPVGMTQKMETQNLEFGPSPAASERVGLSLSGRGY